MSLSNFPADSTISGPDDPFSESFVAGVKSERAYLVAVNSPGTAQPKDLVQFKKTWDAGKQSDRIFVSFSGKDMSFAKRVAEALKSKGYVVFLYKNGEADIPAVNAVETGQFFRRLAPSNSAPARSS